MMKISTIAAIALSAAVLGAAPGVALSQILTRHPQAAIEAESGMTSSAVNGRLADIGRRLNEAKLANFTRPLPQAEYVEAQREVARGDYRAASANLDQVEQQLDSIPN